jgi:hypothetical protein
MSTTTASHPNAARPFARDRSFPFHRGWGGWTLASLNVLAALNSSWFFLAVLGTGVEGWLMMNSCAPSIALFASGFLLARPILTVAGAVMMLRYGTLGLFVFGWQGPNLFAQGSHVLMTLAVLYVAGDLIRARRSRALALGTALGLAVLLPYMLAQHLYFTAHPGLLEQLFSGSFGVPGGVAG